DVCSCALCLSDSDHAITTLDRLSIADQRNWTTLASGSTSAALTIGLMSRTVHDGGVVNPAASQLIGNHFDPRSGSRPCRAAGAPDQTVPVQPRSPRRFVAGRGHPGYAGRWPGG